jgi:Holliday junction resolvase RusA-like endonuclease
MQVIVFKINGEPASKSNSRRLVSFGGRPRVIKSAKALDYGSAFKQQAAEQMPCAMIEGDVSIEIRIWYASRRPDLDESLILDLLQDVAYLNDRQVKEKHIYWMGVDKVQPRCEIVVTKK